jgi:small-conductance mechanosensitive channel/CRP-like cAMP-binding protein
VTWSSALAWYLGFLVALIPLLIGVMALSRNTFIRRKLRTSLVLVIAALAYELIFHHYYPKEPITNLGLILAALALINAAAAVLFNPFREERISDRYPRIVQDAVVVGAFVLIVTYIGGNKLLATSAIGGLVLGLALQDTLGNLFAGLAIQIEKPFRVGDWIKAANYEGRVTELTWRATKIRTKSGGFVIIPNSLVSKDTLVNYSQPSPVQRMEHTIGLGYEAAPNLVKRVVLETFASIPEILTQPAPDVLLSQYADFSINYRCRFWINDFAQNDAILDKFTTLLYYRLKRAGLTVPFPIQDLRIARRPATEHAAAPDHRLDFVEKAGLFQELNPEDKQAIAAAMQPITFGCGETIIRQGEQGDSMFFICQGAVRVILGAAGDSHEVKRLGAGDFFGEMALLTGEPRTASVVADCDVDAYILCKEPFRLILERDPKIAEEISRTMVTRKVELEHEATQLASRQTVARLDVQKNLLARIQRFFRLG